MRRFVGKIRALGKIRGSIGHRIFPKAANFPVSPAVGRTSGRLRISALPRHTMVVPGRHGRLGGFQERAPNVKEGSAAVRGAVRGAVAGQRALISVARVAVRSGMSGAAPSWRAAATMRTAVVASRTADRPLWRLVQRRAWARRAWSAK